MGKEAVISAVMLVVLAGLTCVYFAWEKARKTEDGFQISSVFRRSKAETVQLAVGIFLAVITWVLGHIVRNQDVYWTYKWQIAIFAMVPIAYIDYKQRIIPNKLLLIILLAMAFVYTAQILDDPSYAKMYLLNAGVGALLGGGIFVIASMISKNGIGAGDIKLYFVLGLLLSFRGIFNVLLYSTIISCITALVFLILKKKKIKDELPLAPFTLIGVVLSIALGV